MRRVQQLLLSRRPHHRRPRQFRTSEAVRQTAKFPAHPDVQQRIAEALTAKDAAAIGRTPGVGIDPGRNAQRVDVMRWVLRMKREANRQKIDAVRAVKGGRPIIEVSKRDPWWGARPVADRYEGNNVLGRQLRQQLRENDPAARPRAWIDRIRVGCLASP